MLKSLHYYIFRHYASQRHYYGLPRIVDGLIICSISILKNIKRQNKYAAWLQICLFSKIIKQIIKGSD